MSWPAILILSMLAGVLAFGIACGLTLTRLGDDADHDEDELPSEAELRLLLTRTPKRIKREAEVSVDAR